MDVKVLIIFVDEWVSGQTATEGTLSVVLSAKVKGKVTKAEITKLGSSTSLGAVISLSPGLSAIPKDIF